MWTFDNNVRDAISEARSLLLEDKQQEFLDAQSNVIHLVRDILKKEEDVLYPASIKLISSKEFIDMQKSDLEIGYCLIKTPPLHLITEEETTPADNNLISDLSAVLKKYGIGDANSSNQVLDVSQGKLTLEQINLIFRHLPVDISYVDENDIVKFYSDTEHRVFPRSAGVIGREVQNCHPRESVETVEAIIEAFRKGEQDSAEFWIGKGDTFIYILYKAVRDADGTFRGVLEMMQNATHIRSLSGSQTLLSWDNQSNDDKENCSDKKEDHLVNIQPDTTIADLLKQYPFLKDFLISLNPKFKMLNNPFVFKTMGNIANLGMIAEKGGLKVDELVTQLKAEVERHK